MKRHSFPVRDTSKGIIPLIPWPLTIENSNYTINKNLMLFAFKLKVFNKQQLPFLGNI